MPSRICRIDDQLLAFSARLSPAARIRQADRIRMLYLAVHRPYRKPSIRFFDTTEEYFRFRRSVHGKQSL